jgi:hypothetical protein
MNELDPEIRTFLKRFVHRRRAVVLLERAGWAMAIALLAVTIVQLLPHEAGTLCALAATGGILWIVARPLATLFRRIDWIAAAEQIERRSARFGEMLQTVTSQMLSTRSGSSPMLENLRSQVHREIRLNESDPNISTKPAAIAWSAAAIAGTVLGMVMVFR